MKKVKIFICLMFLMLPLLLYSQNREHLNTLLLQLDTAKTDSIKAHLYKNISYYFLSFNLDSAEYFAEKAISKYEELENFQEIVNSTFVLAMSLQYNAKFDKAIDIVLKLLTRTIEKNEKFLQARCNHLLGELNRSAEYFTQALNHTEKAKKIYIELELDNSVAECFNRIAAIYYEKKKYNLAILYADSSLILCRKNNNQSFIVNNLDIKGSSYKSLEEYKKALTIYKEAIKLSETLDIPALTPNILRNISEIYFELENYNKSIEFAMQAYNIAKQNDNQIYIQNISIILSKSYGKINDFENAYKFSEIARNIYTETFNKEKNEQIAELNTKYETEKKLLQIKNQKNDILNHELKLKNKQTQNYILALIIILTLIIIIIIFISRLKQKKQNIILSEKNHEIHLQNEEIHLQSENLKSMNDKLMELNKFKIETNSMLVHDIKNPLNSILLLTKNKKVLQAGYVIQNIIQNILEVSKAQTNKLNLSIKDYSLNKIIKTAITRIELLINNKNLLIIHDYSNNYILKVDFDLTVRIFENLLTNAIKFSPLNAKIHIYATKFDDNFLQIFVKDTGKGIEKQYIDAIFGKYKQEAIIKSGLQKSTGLGLSFCKIAIETHKGTIKIESEAGKGFKIIFTLPLSENTTINSELSEQKPIIKQSLSKDDKNKISQYIEQLNTIDIYEASEIITILNKINFTKNKNIQTWTIKIKQAVFNGNNRLFKKLLN